MTLKGNKPVKVIYTKEQGTMTRVTFKAQATQTEKVNEIQLYTYLLMN